MSAKIDDFLELYLRYYFSLFFFLQITIKLGIFHWSLLILWRSPKQCWRIFAYNWFQSKGNHGLSKTIVQPTINITGLTSLSTRLRDLMFNTSFNTDFLLVCFICLKKAPSDDTLKIKKICFSPKVSIQPFRSKSDSAAPGAIWAQFMAKKAQSKGYSSPRWGPFQPLGLNQPLVIGPY